MAFMPPSSLYVRQTWRKKDVSHALHLSAEAMKKHNSISKFLSKHGVNNLFLMGTNSGQLPAIFEVLVDSSSVGGRWGKGDMIVNISQITDQSVKLQWLQGAANFGGALYLMDLSLSEDEASALWDALCCAHTSAPTSLFFLLDFRVQGDRRGATARALMDTLKLNPNVSNLAVFRSSLEFLGDWQWEGISLNTLHLEGVTVGQNFIETFAMLESSPVTNTLTLAWCEFIIRAEVAVDRFHELSYTLQLFIYSKVLRWQLRHLALGGFDEMMNDLIPAMQQLKKCTKSSLYSLSLVNSTELPSRVLRDQKIVGAVVDALQSSGLPSLYLGGLEKDAAIQAQLSRNQPAYLLRQPQHNKEPAVAVRLFICGDAYAGKTTLVSTLSSLCSSAIILNTLKAIFMHRGSPQRTEGIEVHTIMRDEVRLSIWDMAGQTEFHAFHDHMFPDPSTNHGSPAMFMFVWSPVNSKDQRLGKIKQEDEFEASFRYWLKFITSKTRQSNILRKLIVVLTRMDQMQFVRDALRASIDTLTTTFKEIIQVVEVVEVDARSPSSVEPLASCIFQTAHDVLEGVEVFSICNNISKLLASMRAQKSKQPIISWDAFNNLCSDKFGLTDEEVLKAIAYSLNESGDIIYLSNLPFLVIDPDWFCHEAMGRLIHFHKRKTPKAIIPMRGYANQAFLEKLLKEISRQYKTIEGSFLLALMEAMHLCCKVPGDANGRYFIPAALSLEERRPLQWRGLSRAITGRSTYGYTYVGRRLECDKKDLTFLTPGLFPTIQVLFNKAFCETRADVKLGKADVKLGKNFISICAQDMEIIVEWGLAKGEHAIDVMVRAPDDDDVKHTLAYVEEEIINTVINVCAQPVGNQGVRLVEGVIRPDCLEIPAPSHVREDQCVLVYDLKQELKEQLEGGRKPERLLHLWEGNRHLQPVTDHFIDLLGCEEYMQVLMSYKSSLQEASLISFTATGGGLMQNNVDFQRASTSFQVGGGSLMQEDVDLACTSSHIAGARLLDSEGTSTGSQGKNLIRDVAETEASHSHKWMRETSPHIIAGEKDEPYEVAASKSMVRKIYREMRSMKTRLDGVRSSVDSMHQDIRTKLDGIHGSITELRSCELPKIQRMVEQCLNFAVESEVGIVPRFGFLTTGDAGFRRRMVKVLFKDVKHVRIELFCEQREGPHRVDGQEGIDVTTVGDATLLKKALPHVNRFLKVLTVVAKVGAHVFAGAGSTIPDLSKLTALALDTPGFLDNEGVLANLSISPDEDYSGWKQWLVSVLEKNGGMTESNIASKFMLKRARYKDTSKVAWLCGRHYKEQCARSSPE